MIDNNTIIFSGIQRPMSVITEWVL